MPPPARRTSAINFCGLSVAWLDILYSFTRSDPSPRRLHRALEPVVDQVRHEPHVVHQVAPGHPARLDQDPPGPLEAELTQELRAALVVARDPVQERADTQTDRGL